jgi:hypothetical protein
MARSLFRAQRAHCASSAADGDRIFELCIRGTHIWERPIDLVRAAHRCAPLPQISTRAAMHTRIRTAADALPLRCENVAGP